MYLKSLLLQNFRNFFKKTFEFSQNSNLILAPNASGKTNLLEAIFLLATGKSFRANLDLEMISFEKEFARVEGKLPDKTLTVFLQRLGETNFCTKKLQVNGLAKRNFDFAGFLRVVLFTPEEIEIVSGAPAARRRHLDLFLGQLEKTYQKALQNYQKAIVQRNRLLEKIRDREAKKEDLGFWDIKILENGEVLMRQRKSFFEFLETRQREFRFLYQPSEISKEKLTQNLEKEILAGMTLSGPHRDDFLFLEDKRDLASFGSRGEQREALLALKILELEYILQKTGERPLLLLDDIFSEFDHAHRRKLFQIIPGHQTIITSTDRHLIEEEYLKKVKVLRGI